MKTLVTNASNYGVTTEIAEKIRQVLYQVGFSVDAVPVKAALDLRWYNAVALGSAAYMF